MARKPRRPDILAEVVWVTPSLAVELLENSTDNRHLSSVRVERYARDFARGAWQMNGQTIVRTAEGKLLDGQHRLAAILLAHTHNPEFIGEYLLIITGVEEIAFLTMDTGRSRTAADVLSISGHAYSTKLAAALRLLHAQSVGRWGTGGRSDRKATNAELMEIFAQHPRLPDTVREWEQHYYRTWRGVTPRAGIFALYCMHQIDPAAARRFWQQLTSGLGYNGHSPMGWLRKRFTRRVESRERMSTRDQIGLLFTAWNQVRRGDPARAVAWNPSMDIPELEA